MGIFISFVLAVGYFLGASQGNGYLGLGFAAILSAVMTLGSYYQGDKMALWSAGAVRIKKEDNPYVWRMVENLSITAGLPMPAVHIIPSNALNAFATGRDPQHASIAVTIGLINTLENEELEGVLAHELSHVQNYDIRIMTIVLVLVGIVGILSDFFTHRLFWSSRDDRENMNPFFMIAGIILAILSPIIAMLIQLAISRKREFLADASAALLTRYPDGLASALRKISGSDIPLETANSSTAHLFISNPFGKKFSISSLFSTHPPIEERIKELEKML
ncbi:MAG: hypothetical protein G01um101418_350 [Parcubacteria group bacterium Gr01-1014_18]|nr:MAG: hypothetical protein Greene041636_274 [Parcubacteria group bacterium Greene0416_36]TSC81210.1 MAG: hypothetical protein G01um101418_350 [Parcubacteria group bacterium Gr01-1014_18]TSC99207.1 MAG: hypothetical protein Greene101420_352 [Parcubacteria group bacterium Greene1014_20]TSD07435.1 MAG: hypothetical protein Greene07142_134 [Parcubacteria group bacterium Greene0714_2]